MLLEAVFGGVRGVRVPESVGRSGRVKNGRAVEGAAGRVVVDRESPGDDVALLKVSRAVGQPGDVMEADKPPIDG